jgi:hypothetical protein
MKPVVSNANNAINSFTSASSVGYPLDDASMITHTAESISARKHPARANVRLVKTGKAQCE